MRVFKQLRSLHILLRLVVNPLLTPFKASKTGSTILGLMEKGLLGHSPERTETEKKPKTRRTRRGFVSKGIGRLLPLILVPTCVFFLIALLLQGRLEGVTQEVKTVTLEVRTVFAKRAAALLRQPKVVTQTVEVPVLTPLELFESDEFVRSEYVGRGKFLKSDKPKGFETERERLDAIKDKYWLNVWRLDAEFRHAAMDKMKIPIVNLPPADRTSEPLCNFSDTRLVDQTREVKTLTPRPDRTVYDVFLMKDEVDLLEIRMHELAAVVDWFVVVQCPVTFQNRPANLVDPLKIEGVAELRHKIKRVMCDLEAFPSEDTNPWRREEYMRNLALDAVLDVARSEDLILYGDLDELPSGATIEKVVRMEIEEFPLVLQMPLYRTNFGCIDREFYVEKQWAGTVVTTGKLARSREPPFHETGNQLRWELRSHGSHVIKCAGWHCSSCMDVSTIVSKLSEYSHADEIGEDQKDPDIVLDEIESCHFGFWKRARTWRGLPSHVVANAERFAYLMPR